MYLFAAPEFEFGYERVLFFLRYGTRQDKLSVLFSLW